MLAGIVILVVWEKGSKEMVEWERFVKGRQEGSVMGELEEWRALGGRVVLIFSGWIVAPDRSLEILKGSSRVMGACTCALTPRREHEVI